MEQILINLVTGALGGVATGKLPIILIFRSRQIEAVSVRRQIRWRRS